MGFGLNDCIDAHRIGRMAFPEMFAFSTNGKEIGNNARET
jgi:hypothetical protein